MIAKIKFRINQFSDCLDVQKSTCKIKEKIFIEKNPFYFAISLKNLGDTYFLSRDYKNAVETHLKCLGILEKLQGFHKESSHICLNIAYDYEKLGESQKALEYVHKSLTYSGIKTNSNMENTVETYESVGVAKDYKVKDLEFDTFKME